jgi:hypothetical protein
MNVEITDLLDLTQEQAALIDMHSVLNIMNVLLNELEYLQEVLREEKALQPALDTIQQIREHLRSSDDIGIELGHLLKCEDRVMGVVRVVCDTHPEAVDNSDVEDSVSNLQSVFAIVDVRIRELLERVHAPEKWTDHDIEQRIGNSLPIRFAQLIVCRRSVALATDAAARQVPLQAGRRRISGSGGANRIGRGNSSCFFGNVR